MKYEKQYFENLEVVQKTRGSSGVIMMSQEQEIIDYGKMEYVFCGGNLFEDMEKYVSNSKRVINKFLSK